MNAARQKQAAVLEPLYVDLLVKMNIFLEKLNEFSKAISKKNLILFKITK
jgi:hypothetical protein